MVLFAPPWSYLPHQVLFAPPKIFFYLINKTMKNNENKIISEWNV